MAAKERMEEGWLNSTKTVGKEAPLKDFRRHCYIINVYFIITIIYRCRCQSSRIEPSYMYLQYDQNVLGDV